MITSNIAINQDLPQISQKTHLTGQEHEELDRANKEASRKDAGRVWDKIDKDIFPFSRLQASNLGVNTVAQGIRIADRAMEEIGIHIDRIKDELQVHVKNYPPFLTGSDERVKLSNDFNAFRKLIDQLTFPPEDKTAARIMADQSLFEPEDREIVVEHKGFSRSIHSRRVHTGPDGLDIPELSPHATDDDIHLMIKKLDFAKNTLIKRRTMLSADAPSIMNPPAI